ncbi:ProQ/FinO family protein [Endozoicomonas euniceicola]|uniref:ProQ/FinO family protein n=1 Tax=Endozoicomonas euniceicola TaxID=1234143 RepID=A0ABY6GMX0_9GAMM|nr:ProQ/FinO family protein [Endozoicomonas euniceicola]UYM14046.1 ProQ/FinO family protein [Endozoicomonas euniceicola]
MTRVTYKKKRTFVIPEEGSGKEQSGKPTPKTEAEEKKGPVKAPDKKEVVGITHKQRLAMFKRLQKHWPDLFAFPPKPLKVGIREDLIADLEGKGESSEWLAAALQQYVRSLPYHRAVAKGDKRYGLNGEAEEIQENQKEFARVRVAHITKRMKTRAKDAPRPKGQSALSKSSDNRNK